MKGMTKMNNELVLNYGFSKKDEIIVVSSRIVAEKLGKRHDHIIRDLENILQNSKNPNVGSLIISSFYKVKGQNREYKEYLLTKDGFTLYMFNIQGFNEFKLDYINKFNLMEQTIKENISLEQQLIIKIATSDTAEKRAFALSEYNEKIVKPLQLENQILKPKSDKYDSHLSKGKTYNASEIAIRFGLGVKKFNKTLCDLGIQYKQKESYRLYSQYEGKGYVKYITMEKELINPDTEELEIREYNSMKWTELGYEFLEKKLLKKKIIKLKEKNEKLDDGVRYVNIT